MRFPVVIPLLGDEGEGGGARGMHPVYLSWLIQILIHRVRVRVHRRGSRGSIVASRVGYVTP